MSIRYTYRMVRDSFNPTKTTTICAWLTTYPSYLLKYKTSLTENSLMTQKPRHSRDHQRESREVRMENRIRFPQVLSTPGPRRSTRSSKERLIPQALKES